MEGLGWGGGAKCIILSPSHLTTPSKLPNHGPKIATFIVYREKQPQRGSIAYRVAWLIPSLNNIANNTAHPSFCLRLITWSSERLSYPISENCSTRETQTWLIIWEPLPQIHRLKTSKQGLSDWPGDTFKVILGPDFFLSLVDTQEMKQSNRTEKHRKLVRISWFSLCF